MADQHKPPSVFHRYPDLPMELKLKIVEQAEPSIPRQKKSHLACIDRAWQETIEKRTFRRLQLSVSDFLDFDRVCVGRRRQILKTICLQIQLESCHLDDSCGDVSGDPDDSDDSDDSDDFGDADDYGDEDGNEFSVTQVTDPTTKYMHNTVKASNGQPSPSEVALNAFTRLFQSLRTWQVDPDRAPGELVNLEYYFHHPTKFAPRRRISCSFETLPMLQVVGNVQHWSPKRDSFYFGPESALSLLLHMRNLATCKVDLRVDRAVQTSIDSVNSLLLSIEPIQARLWNMTELHLKNGTLFRSGSREVFETCNTSFRTLTISVFSLTHRLEKLVLYHVVDVGHFFRAPWDTCNNSAQQSTTWPRLRHLEIRGSFAHDSSSAPKVTSDVLLAVTKALPHMPAIDSLEISLFDQDCLAISAVANSEPDFRIEFLKKSEGDVWYDHGDLEPMPEKTSRLRISRFLLTPELMQPWEDFAREQGAMGIQIYRGKWLLDEGFMGYHWDGDTIQSQEDWDNDGLWDYSDSETSDTWNPFTIGFSPFPLWDELSDSDWGW